MEGIVTRIAIILAGVTLAWLTGASPVSADDSHRHGYHAPQVKTYTRIIDGKSVPEAVIIFRHGKRYKGRGRRAIDRYPRCRTGLFGRIVNKPCRPRTRKGGLFDGRRY